MYIHLAKPLQTTTDPCNHKRTNKVRTHTPKLKPLGRGGSDLESGLVGGSSCNVGPLTPLVEIPACGIVWADTPVVLQVLTKGAVDHSSEALWQLQRPCLPVQDQYMKVDPIQDVYMKVDSIRRVHCVSRHRVHLPTFLDPMLSMV